MSTTTELTDEAFGQLQNWINTHDGDWAVTLTPKDKKTAPDKKPYTTSRFGVAAPGWGRFHYNLLYGQIESQALVSWKQLSNSTAVIESTNSEYFIEMKPRPPQLTVGESYEPEIRAINPRANVFFNTPAEIYSNVIRRGYSGT